MKKIVILLATFLFSSIYAAQPCEKQLLAAQNVCAALKKDAKTAPYAECMQLLCTKEEPCYGAQDLRMAKTFFTTAVALHTAKEYKKAIVYYRKSLEIRIKKLGSDHVDVAAVYNGLAWSYASTGELDLARENFSKALEIRRVKLGENANETKTSYSNLEWINKATPKHEAPKATEPLKQKEAPRQQEILQQKDYVAILTNLNKELEEKEKTAGPAHLQTAVVYVKIASVYEEKGEFERAVLYFNKALAIRRALLGEAHQDTVELYKAMGTTYCYAGSYNKALVYFAKALNFYETYRGLDHVDTAAVYNNIGWAYSAMKDGDKALEYLQKAMTVYRAKLAPDDQRLGSVYHNMASVYDGMGIASKAKEYRELVSTTRFKLNN